MCVSSALGGRRRRRRRRSREKTAKCMKRSNLPWCKVRRKPGFVPGTFRGLSQEQPDPKIYVYVPFSCLRQCIGLGRTQHIHNCQYQGAREGGRSLRKDVFLPSKHFLSGFYKTLPSKNPSNKLSLVYNEDPYRRLLRTLLRSTCC